MEEPPTHTPDSRRRFRAVLGVALAFVPWLFVVHAVWRFGFFYPTGDDWRFVPFLEQLAAGDLQLAEVWALNEGHRMPLLRLVLLGLATATRWDLRAPIALSLVLATAAALLFGLRAARAFDAAGARGGWLLLPLFSLLFFNLNHWLNWMSGNQVWAFMIVFFAAAVLSLLTSPDRGYSHVAGAALLALAASLTSAPGLALWPMGLALLLAPARDAERLGMRGRFAVIWAAGGAVAGFVYLASIRSGASGAVSPVVWAKTFVQLIGAAPLVFRPQFAMLAGLLGLAGAAFLFARASAFQGPRRTASLPFAGLVVFALGVAALVAHGRGAWPGSAFAPRYMTFTNLFWVGLAGLALLWAAPEGGHKGRWRSARVALVTAGAVLLAACAVLASRRGYYTVEEYDRFHRPEARRMVVDHLPEPPPRLTTMIEGPFARELAFLRANRLTVFAPGRFPYWAGE